MDRATVAALVVAATSVIASLVSGQSEVHCAFYGLWLIVPVLIIAYPEIAEWAFRTSRSGFVHGGESPVPPTMIRASAWVLLVVIIVVHHSMQYVGGS